MKNSIAFNDSMIVRLKRLDPRFKRDSKKSYHLPALGFGAVSLRRYGGLWHAQTMDKAFIVSKPSVTSRFDEAVKQVVKLKERHKR